MTADPSERCEVCGTELLHQRNPDYTEGPDFCPVEASFPEVHSRHASLRANLAESLVRAVSWVAEHYGDRAAAELSEVLARAKKESP